MKRIRGCEVRDNGVATVISIGDFVIAIPSNCPLGISKRHGDDDLDIELGAEISVGRMFKDAKDKDFI